ncbi:MAG: hypothetical protein WD960_15740 [Gemmatimonadota bacterium]
MRSLRLLSLILAFGFLSACSDLGPVASEDDSCEGDATEQCDPPPPGGYLGSDS